MPIREMLINIDPGEECRIAIVEDGHLEELYQERASAESHVGNMYKGEVVNVEPSIQAAFIDFGLPRNGFLHISDLHPKYFHGDAREQTEKVGKKTPRRDRPPIQKCLRRGQAVLVQVLKEGIGSKGPTVTTYLSIPGRYLVMMPDMTRLGVSRKIEDEEVRRATRKLLDELDPPSDFGFIVRTAGIGRAKADLRRDLAFLQRLWKAISHRMQRTTIGELYTESDLVIRTIRDVFSGDISRIIVDQPDAGRRARDFITIASPRASSSVVLTKDPVPLFHRYKLEEQIESINARSVSLPSGGSLVIDQTEAIVAIDVNSGRMRENADAETTAFRTNLEAADEICRQLRLRDLGGVIINDMIDMHPPRHRRAIEQRFRENLRRDRARTRVSSISQFGILEMTRQRMRPSLTRSTYIDCPHCEGTSRLKSAESVVLDAMRRLALALSHTDVAKVELTVSPSVAFQLLNRKRSQLTDLERRHKKPVMVRVSEGKPVDVIKLLASDNRNGEVDFTKIGLPDEAQLIPIDDVVEPLSAESITQLPTTEGGAPPPLGDDKTPSKLPVAVLSSSERKSHRSVRPKAGPTESDSNSRPRRASSQRRTSKPKIPSKKEDPEQPQNAQMPVSRGYHNRRETVSPQTKTTKSKS